MLVYIVQQSINIVETEKTGQQVTNNGAPNLNIKQHDIHYDLYLLTPKSESTDSFTDHVTQISNDDHDDLALPGKVADFEFNTRIGDINRDKDPNFEFSMLMQVSIIALLAKIMFFTTCHQHLTSTIPRTKIFQFQFMNSLLVTTTTIHALLILHFHT